MGVIAGPPGIGKSTLAKKAGALFLPTERGLDQIGADRLPLPKTYLEFKRSVQWFATEQDEYKTLAIDTIDGLEQLIWDEVCEEKQVSSIEQPDYGAGYVAAQTKWRKLLLKFQEMSEERFNILLLSHMHIKTFNDPAQPDPYDVYRIKLNDKSAAIIKERVDNIMFAAYDVTPVKDGEPGRKNKASARLLHSGNRILITRASTGYPEAKNRFDFPDEMPLDWDALEQGIKDFYGK